MKIAFLWDGVRNHYGLRFKDGLWAALQILKEKHEIRIFEPITSEEPMIHAFRPDVILYWGALIENSKPFVASLPYKKAMCFAGGPIEAHNVDGFDLYFVESEQSELEFKAFNKPFLRAFGVNEQLYVPQDLEKRFDAYFCGTFALWKRPKLFAHSVGNKGVWIGIKQAHEKECYEVCEQNGVEIHDELPRNETLEFINSSYTALNTADFWGGGQRMTLEAMSCNVPPIVMSDSPKNMEYIDESGWGLIVEPNEDAIREAIRKLKGQPCNSRDYILSKWTAQHYADALEQGLQL